MKPLSNIQTFIPAIFCAFISLMPLFLGETGKPAFFSFLPMCFFFAAMPAVNLNKRVAALEEQLKQATATESSNPS